MIKQIRFNHSINSDRSASSTRFIRTLAKQWLSFSKTKGLNSEKADHVSKMSYLNFIVVTFLFFVLFFVLRSYNSWPWILYMHTDILFSRPKQFFYNLVIIHVLILKYITVCSEPTNITALRDSSHGKYSEYHHCIHKYIHLLIEFLVPKIHYTE